MAYFRCPACGWSNTEDLHKEAQLYLKERSKGLQVLINKTFNLVDRNIYKGKMPVKNKDRFLFSIACIKSEEVRRGIRTYLYNKYYKKNKDLSYLSGIIRNLHLRKTAEKEAEKNMYGLNPPEIKQPKKKEE